MSVESAKSVLKQSSTPTVTQGAIQSDTQSAKPTVTQSATQSAKPTVTQSATQSATQGDKSTVTAPESSDSEITDETTTDVKEAESDVASDSLTAVSDIVSGVVADVVTNSQILNAPNEVLKSGGNIKNIFNTQKVSGTVSILNKIVILFMAIIIIAVSSSGYYIKKHCTDKNININSSMIEFFMGFGTGLIFYIVFDILKIVSIPIIVILGLFLSVIGSIYVNIYSKMDSKCTEDSMITELSIGILGCGIGIIMFALLYSVLNFVKNPITKSRVVALITSIFLIIIPSIIINMTNKCSNYDDSVNENTVKSIKIAQIVSLVLSILVFIGICISFIYIAPTR